MPIIIMLATSCRRSGRRCGDENGQYSYKMPVYFHHVKMKRLELVLHGEIV